MTKPPLLIAVVDDDEVTRFVIAAMLGLLGFEAVEAVDGLEGVDIVLARRPAAVLMDLNMPRMDGIQALLTIREREPQLRAPVLAVTANTTSAMRLACAAAGFDDFLEKPVDLERLRAALAGRIPLTPD
jgi:CheY-like chemotaxis protein